MQEIIHQIEDHLAPRLKFDVYERVLYYHLFRRTHLEGRTQCLVSIDPLAQRLGISSHSVRTGMRSLETKKCVKLERSQQGHLVTVLLPGEIEGAIPPSAPDDVLDVGAVDFYTGRKYLSAILRRENNRCFYCDRAISQENCALDHVKPQLYGQDNSYRNIVAACHDCNSTKQGQDVDAFLRSLYRRGLLSQQEFESRAAKVRDLIEGKLIPELQL